MNGNIVIIGSDLHPPCQSMEARIAETLVRGIPELIFTRVSICVGKAATHDPGFVYIDGLRQWPLFTRKFFYALKLIFVIIRLRLQGSSIFHFIWTGPVWLMRSYSLMIHIVRGKTIFTVLNRFINPSAY
ncbi:MAG TPA: hypothetical protein VLN56_02035, partial [Gammaproteobacteria bacterium]|nr:hypothetical protein [Gammaproteobacteria bacterium]